MGGEDRAGIAKIPRRILELRFAMKGKDDLIGKTPRPRLEGPFRIASHNEGRGFDPCVY
jgi:hypothetical protein